MAQPALSIASSLLQAAAGLASVSHGPTPLNDPRSWATDADYPPAAVQDHNSGTVAVKLGIDERGGVTSCSIAETSSIPVLDRTTCDLLEQRARFAPAQDAHGLPITSTYSTAVRWTVPTMQLPSGPLQMVTIDRIDGSLTCSTEVDGDRRVITDDACSAIATALQESHQTLPATIGVQWPGPFPPKPAALSSSSDADKQPSRER